MRPLFFWDLCFRNQFLAFFNEAPFLGGRVDEGGHGFLRRIATSRAPSPAEVRGALLTRVRGRLQVSDFAPLKLQYDLTNGITGIFPLLNSIVKLPRFLKIAFSRGFYVGHVFQVAV